MSDTPLRNPMQNDACFVTHTELDVAIERCKAECALHRKDAVMLIERSCQRLQHDCDDEQETFAEKIDKKIDSLAAKTDVKFASIIDANQKFYRDVILTLVGVIVTLAIGFASIVIAGVFQ